MRALAVILGATLFGCGLVLGLKDPQPADLSEGGTDPSEAGAVASGTCVADLKRDKTHCGKCGHDCQGGSCQEGVCQPFVLATEIDTPTDVGVNGDGVFWVATNAGDGTASLRTCRAPGCTGGAKTMSTTPKPKTTLVVRPDSVFWRTTGSIARCPTKGCGSKPTEIVIGDPDSVLARSRGDTLQFTTTTAAEFSRSILGCKTPNCEPITQLVEATTGPFAMASNSTHLYWARWTGQGEPIDSIVRCAIADCHEEILVTNAVANRLDLNPGGTALVWSGNNELHRCTLPGCSASAETLFVAKEPIDQIAIDDKDVYFTTTSGLYKCAISGCNGSPARVDSTAGTKPGLAVDAAGIYWTNETKRTVMKLVK